VVGYSCLCRSAKARRSASLFNVVVKQKKIIDLFNYYASSRDYCKTPEQSVVVHPMSKIAIYTLELNNFRKTLGIDRCNELTKG
jgi:hypothetical protein